MLIRTILSAALFSGLLFFVPADAAAQDRSPEFTKAKIERLVRKEILSLPYYGVFDAIGFEVNNGTVTLTGYVLRPYTKKDAEESVKDVEGVSEVINNIEVLPLSPSDDRLRQRLLRAMGGQTGALYRYFLGTNPSIRIIVKNGHVTLEGFADRKSDADLAYITARGVSGSFSVTNNLKVIGEAR
ncbi:MAG: BON domain-containing protein [Pyrinomonadaceae bacterium]